MIIIAYVICCIHRFTLIRRLLNPELQDINKKRPHTSRCYQALQCCQPFQTTLSCWVWREGGPPAGLHQQESRQQASHPKWLQMQLNWLQVLPCATGNLVSCIRSDLKLWEVQQLSRTDFHHSLLFLSFSHHSSASQWQPTSTRASLRWWQCHPCGASAEPRLNWAFGWGAMVACSFHFFQLLRMVQDLTFLDCRFAIAMSMAPPNFSLSPYLSVSLWGVYTVIKFITGSLVEKLSSYRVSKSA